MTEKDKFAKKETKVIQFAGTLILFGTSSALITEHKSVNQAWMIVTTILAVASAVMIGYYLSPKTKVK